jgi:hypothetical protein
MATLLGRLTHQLGEGRDTLSAGEDGGVQGIGRCGSSFEPHTIGGGD